MDRIGDSRSSRRRLVILVVGMALLAVACTDSNHGPWVDANGRQLQNSEVLEYDGFNRCNQRSVTFLQLYDRQYAKDLEGVLGDLYSPVTGELLTFDSSTTRPPGIEATGIRHRVREIYVDFDTIDDYLYLVYDNGTVERWPRAETECR